MNKNRKRVSMFPEIFGNVPMKIFLKNNIFGKCSTLITKKKKKKSSRNNAIIEWVSLLF